MKKLFLLFSAAMGFALLAHGQIVHKSKELFSHYRQAQSRDALRKEIAINAEGDFKPLNFFKQ